MRTSIQHTRPAPAPLGELFSAALTRRQPLIDAHRTQAFRAFSGAADGLDGVFIDVYAQGATLIVYEGKQAANQAFTPPAAAAAALEVLRPLGVRAVYFKPFAKDRSRLGGELPAVATDPAPLAGEPLPESILITELDWKLEIRLFDGLSTGLFLDQRDNRGWVSQWCRDRARTSTQQPRILNTFAYTCAFSIAAARGGAATTSVDVSPRYLDWGKRNFSHNGFDDGIASGEHRFARMDTFEFFNYARRKQLTYDLIILDPPSFAAGSKKKGIKPFSSVDDYARLVREAAALLTRQGVILASTNTAELCRPGRLEHEISKGLGRDPRGLKLPGPPIDFARDRDRFAARAFTPSDTR
jgi:23S rRNA (cytosine1962-C5)-methyltransferase